MIFTRAGFGALKFAYFVLLAGLGVGVFLVGGSYLYWQAEKKNDQQSLRSSQDLRGRLGVAKRDREDLLGSEDTYKALIARGMFLAEQRFDLIEALAALKNRHRLVSLTYEVAPQRPLRLGNDAAYAGVNLLASRIKLKVRASHDADLVAFLDEFPRLQRGFFPLDRCTIKRLAESQAAFVASSVPPTDDATTASSRVGASSTTRATPIASATAALEAECSLEWVTLQTKGGNSATPSGASFVPSPRPL